jgi:hypothetical protein
MNENYRISFMNRHAEISNKIISNLNSMIYNDQVNDIPEMQG